MLKQKKKSGAKRLTKVLDGSERPSSVSHRLMSGDIPLFLPNTRLDGHQGRSRRLEEDRNLVSLLRSEIGSLSYTVRSAVTILTEIFQPVFRLFIHYLVPVPVAAWSKCCECCVLSGRGLSDELITRPEESYRLWCVVVCDLETSWMRRPWPTEGLWRQINNNNRAH